MAAPAPVQAHPNATVAGGLTGLSALVVAVAGWFGAAITATQAVAISGGITTVGLLIGKRGIRGLARVVWRGQG
jgi:hypothetical protein